MQKIRINGNKKINHNDIKAKVGLTDKKNQSVFFFEGSSFITPTEECLDFNKVITDVESTCRKTLKNKLLTHPDLSTDFLMNMEVCSDRMKVGKKTYLYFQYHFKQRFNNNESLVTLKARNVDFFTGLLDDISTNLLSYGITLSKNKA
jgi:hypothetical protein